MDLDNPAFSATDVAQLIDEKPGVVRDWRDRGLAAYVGRKSDFAVSYTVRDAAKLAIIRDLVRLRFPLRVAAHAANILLETAPNEDAVFRGSPQDIATLGPTDSGYAHREIAGTPDVSAALIVLPIGKVWRQTVDRAAALAGQRGTTA